MTTSLPLLQKLYVYQWSNTYSWYMYQSFYFHCLSKAIVMRVSAYFVAKYGLDEALLSLDCKPVDPPVADRSAAAKMLHETVEGADCADMHQAVC